MSDAKLDEIIGLIKTQNGDVAGLMADYYGDSERSIKGTKPQVDENTLTIDRGRTSIKTLMWAGGLIGVGNIAAWVSVIVRGAP